MRVARVAYTIMLDNLGHSIKFHQSWILMLQEKLHNISLLNAANSNDSSIWNYILKAKEFFKNSYEFCLGYGSSLFWYDLWLHDYFQQQYQQQN